MSQIKNSLTDAIHRLSQPSRNQGNNKRRQSTGRTQKKFKLPTMPSASRPRQQQPKNKDNGEARFSIRRPTHQRGKPHQNETKKKWTIFRGQSKKAPLPSTSQRPSFNLRKAVRWASLSKKK
ncbi:hypothetical protein BCR42DRAFT_409234 [Absidia repens]|uniref:Uncharacterized protein n=1 Tax=Absidia repens TaxID=90262 RepID=A0A1X2IQV0_9FUNG|nr:hypothetical protein BCR42DRAFT_409234 [Absidia repens]